MITQYHLLINQLTLSRQSFFPKVDMRNVAQEINRIMLSSGGMVNLIDAQCRTLLH
jgi:hypothetical protein